MCIECFPQENINTVRTYVHMLVLSAQHNALPISDHINTYSK
jgi:hypothetical protein